MRHGLRAVDINARPTSSIMGIVRIMKEEIEELILRAGFGGMSGEVHVEGEHVFRKEDLNRQLRTGKRTR